MNNNQLFDNNIKEQFQGYSPEVHPRIWDNIVKEREKRKPVGFWYTFLNGRNIFLLTAVLLASGTGAYLLLKNNDQKEMVTAAANTPKNTSSPATTSINNNEKTTSPATTTVTDLAATTTSPDVTANNTETTIAGNNNNNNRDDNNSTADHHAYSTSGAAKIKIYGATAQSDEDNNSTASNSNTKKKRSPVTNFDITSTDQSDTNEGEVVKDFYLRKLLFADIQKITATKKTAALGNRSLPNVLFPDCPTFEKDAAGNKTYFEIYAGPDFAFRNLSDTANSAYLQKRKESTKFSSAFSAGVRYTKVFNNGVSIRTGVNYSQINEKFTFSQGSIVQVTYIINANGDTTGSFMTTGTKYKTTVNKFRTIDVPVLIGYELGNGRLHANINAGLMVNVYSWQKGDVLDTAYKPVSITTGKSNSPYQFKTNIGIGFMIGTSFYYKLNDKIHLLAEPYFRYNLSPMSNAKLTLTQKYNTAGLRVGLRIDLH
jgi:hypothetical protein